MFCIWERDNRKKDASRAYNNIRRRNECSRKSIHYVKFDQHRLKFFSYISISFLTVSVCVLFSIYFVSLLALSLFPDFFLSLWHSRKKLFQIFTSHFQLPMQTHTYKHTHKLMYIILQYERSFKTVHRRSDQLPQK